MNTKDLSSVIDRFLTQAALSDGEKTTLRALIGAAGTEDLPTGAVLYNAVQSLTEGQQNQVLRNLGLPVVICSAPEAPVMATTIGGTLLSSYDSAAGRWLWALSPGTTEFHAHGDSFDEETVFDFSGLPTLTVVDLSDSRIVTPPILTGLTALQVLSLDSCTLVTSPPVLAGLTALQTLYLGGTHGGTAITTPPVLTGLTALVTADLSNTLIATPPILTGLTALQTLNLSGTPITATPVLTGLTVLQTLDLSRTLITVTPVLTGLTALQSLHIDHTSVSGFPALTGLTALSLVLASNCSSANAAAVDALYIGLAAATTATHGTCDTSGTTGNPTSASAAARTSLSGSPRDWTITT